MDRAAPPAPAFERSIHLLYVPTLCCNLSCSYCYLGKQTSEAALKRDAQRAVHTLRHTLSSGGTKSRGGITKTGNGHVRRVLVEAAWTYRHPARKTATLQRRAERTSQEVQEIAWNAQKRMCGRYKLLEGRGKLKVQVCTAVARELTGFIWAIGQAMSQPSVKA